jgi:P27 family predicted phage terminase small subunit
MGARGPLPNAKLALVHGGKEGDEETKEQKQPPCRPQEPDWRELLGDDRQIQIDARNEWLLTVEDLIERGELSRADVTAAIDMCMCHARLRQCERIISKEGYTIEGAQGQSVRHPVTATLNQYRAQMQRYRMEFGLSPGTRKRIGFLEPEIPDDDSDLDASD